MGRPINPKLCEGQLEGSVAQGIGSALYEASVLENGSLLNPNFTDYRISGTMQVPSGRNIISAIVEAPHKDGPFGAKGMAEAGANYYTILKYYYQDVEIGKVPP